MNSLFHPALLALSVSTVLLLAFTIALAFYNGLLHPLRKIPGPFLSAITPLPLIYARITGKSVTWIHAQHALYGSVVRVAPNELSFISPDAWKDIYGYGKPSFAKDRTFYGPDIFGEGDDIPASEQCAGIIRADDASHGRQRRVVSHAFSDKALKEQEALLCTYVELLVAKITSLASSDAPTGIDLVSWYNFTTFDIMADLTFGESLGLLEQSAYTPWVRAVFGSVKMASLLQAGHKFPALSYLFDKAVPAAVKEKKRLHMMHSVERVEKRLATLSDRPDIWTYVLQYVNGEGGKSSENGLRGREMHSNAATFMLAGTETTATLLSGLTYYLLKTPDALEKLVKEVRDSFPQKEDMTMANLARLPWLNACLEEGLRVYPPVPVGLPRVTPAQGAVVSGIEVPGGTLVSLHQYSAYHSPLNFKDPDMFLPERWLPDSGDEFNNDNKHVFQPFSYGPRNCLGKNLAYHEMRLVLANIMWHFDLSLCEESEGWPAQDSYLLWEKHPLTVKVKAVRTE